MDRRNRPASPGLSALLTASALALAVSVPRPAAAFIETIEQCIDIGTAVHIVGRIGAQVSPFPFDIPFGLSAYATNLGLKFCPPLIDAPEDIAVRPNTTDGCGFELRQDRTAGVYSHDGNYATLSGSIGTVLPGSLGSLPILPFLEPDEYPYVPPGSPGFPNGFPVWGDLGTPNVRHYNTNVDIHASVEPRAGKIRFPVGHNGVSWKADTLIAVADYIPAPSAKAEVKRKDKGFKKAFKQLLILLADAKALAAKGNDVGPGGIGDLLKDKPHGVRNADSQKVDVFDLHSPTIGISRPRVTVQATELGGERSGDHIPGFRQFVSTSDRCDRKVSFGAQTDFLWHLGENTVTWTAADGGPNLDFRPNTASVTQTVIVEDREPPLLLAPPSRVIESASELARVELGNALAIDRVDKDVTIRHDAPSRFPVNQRTAVTWTATDGGFPAANSVSKTQWITVKSGGSNRPPRVDAVSVNDAITFEPVDIVLTGTDPDELPDGRGNSVPDPLTFGLVEEPENGFFVAPLLPYFITDFRVENEFCLPGQDRERDQCIFYQDQCAAGGRPLLEVVQEPRFVQVMDDGSSYVVDEYTTCSQGEGSNRSRVAHFGPGGEFLAQWPANGSRPQRLTVHLDDSVYYLIDDGGNSPGLVARLQPDLSDGEIYNLRARPCDPSGECFGPLLKARGIGIDEAGLLYVTDGQVIYAYDTMRARNNEVPFVGALLRFEDPDADVDFSGGGGSIGGFGYDMELDSQGNLYVSSASHDRVFKFAKSSQRSDGTLERGAFVGWLGRCDSGVEGACDEDKHVSIGFSCTDSTCSVEGPGGAGSAPGQFDEPQGIAIDPKDVLYVTDYNNLRVQRFTPEGFFAGEARSECEGECFVLGDFGRPRDVSVNSTQFFVLDREEDLLHALETSPFHDVDNESARLVYQSNNEFQGTDRFRYRANDGLADSAAATVSVRVGRNHRAPVAEDTSVSTDEDSALAVRLPAEDPDGALDVLSYEIVSAPSRGQLSGTGAARTYTPDADFFGVDEFTFKANDGREDSNVATVQVVVNPVNDAPQVVFDAPGSDPVEIVGLGYRADFAADISDPDLADVLRLEVAWGDGSAIEPEAAIVFDDRGTEDPADDIVELPRVMLVKPGTADGVGAIDHVYSSPGRREIEVCASDLTKIVEGRKQRTEDSLVHCDRRTVEVRPMADLATQVTASRDLLVEGEEAEVDFEVVAVHNRPDVGNGLTATGVTLRVELAGGALVSSSPSVGSCQRDGSALVCRVAELAPGGDLKLAVRARVDASTATVGEMSLVATVSADQADFLDNGTDRAGVELMLDADSDGDGDGVRDEQDNCRDLRNPGQTDTDGDGRGDACDEDDDGDQLPDTWEIEHGLNPVDSRDARIDSDGDGLSNLEEFRRGTDPRVRNDVTEPPGGEGQLAVLEGKTKLKIKKIAVETLPSRMTLEIGDDRWTASDGEFEISGEVERKSNRKLTLLPDGASVRALLARIEAQATASAGEPVEIELRKDVKFKLKLNKQQTRAKLTAKLSLEAERGQKEKNGSYKISVKGGVTELGSRR